MLPPNVCLIQAESNLTPTGISISPLIIPHPTSTKEDSPRGDKEEEPTVLTEPQQTPPQQQQQFQQQQEETATTTGTENTGFFAVYGCLN